MNNKYLLLTILFLQLSFFKAVAQVSPPDTIAVELTGGDAANIFKLPAKFIATSFTGPLTYFTGSNSKFERGSPLYSSQVEFGATFYVINGFINDFPPRTSTSFPIPNRPGGSSFIAIKEDNEGNRKIWINISVGAVKTEFGFTYDWEYQFRYFEDTKTGTKQATLGTVPNAGGYFGSNVEGTVTMFPNDNPILSIYHQLKGKDGKPTSSEKRLEKVNLNKTELGTLETKICTDGSESTIFKLKGKDISSYSIEVLSIGEPDGEGVIINQEIIEDELIVNFKHPTYFRNVQAFPDYPLFFMIKKNNILQHTFDLRAVRPPVVMVHGIFADRHTFDAMDQALTKEYKLYDPMQIYKVSYVSDWAFDQNASILFMGIETVIDNCKSVKISAGKVDIICHSMGGLVTRAYLQGNTYSIFKNVNKQITLNTPHSGSQITNLLLHPNFREPIRIIADRIKFLSGNLGDTQAGAAESMKVDGDKIKMLNNSTNVAKNDVPIHVIASDFDVSSLDQEIGLFSATASYLLPTLTTAAIVYYKFSLNELLGNPNSIKEFLLELYQGQHDIAVPLNSQQVGLSTPHMTFFKNVRHDGSSDNRLLIDEVVKLLSSNPQGEKFINGGKVTPPDLSNSLPDFLKINPLNQQEEMSVNQLQTLNFSSISIDNITPGSEVIPGSTIPLNIIGSDDVKIIQIVAGNKSISTFNSYAEGPSKMFEYIIPTNAVGKIDLIALAYNESGFIAADTLKFVVATPEAILHTFDIYPKKLLLQRQQITQISVDGQYSDGIDRDITILQDISFISRNNLVKSLGEGKIEAIGLGSDILTVEYLGKSVEVAIEVVEKEVVVKQAQTIDFPPLPDKANGDPAFELSATASSGLPVNFSIVSGPATVSGTMLTITGAGEVTVRALQAGDEDYDPAPVVERSFTVVKASQTISFADILDKAVGDASFQVQPTATSGLPVTVTVVSGPATVADNLVTIIGEGTVNLKASQAGNENYNAAADVERSFCVVPARPTISKQANLLTSSSQAGNQWYLNSNIIEGATSVTYTATESGSYTVQVTGFCGKSLMSGPMEYTKEAEEKQAQTIDFPLLADKTFGDPAFTLSATASSGLPVSFKIVTGPATISGSTLTITGAGTVTVRASQAGDETYEAALDVDLSFNVAKANQTINFTDIPDKAMGAASFQVQPTATSGLSVTVSVVSGPATIAVNTITLTGEEGIVTVLAQQAGSENYLPAVDITKRFCVTPSKPTIIQAENLLSSSRTSGNQWYFNGSAIDGATASTYLAAKSGSYTVQITGLCGMSVMSEPVNVTIDNIPETEAKIFIFPIPVQDILNIIFPNKMKWKEVHIVDINGNLWIKASPKNKGNHIRLGIGHLPRGVYVVMIMTDETTYRESIILD